MQVSFIRAGVVAFERQLFQLAIMSDVEEFKFRDDVVEMMAAAIILNYPDMAKISGNALFQHRVVHALESIGHTENDIVCWSLSL